MATMAQTRVYNLISAKGTITVTGTEEMAIATAQEYETALAPAFGVTVELDDGTTVAEIREGGLVEWADGRQDDGLD